MSNEQSSSVPPAPNLLTIPRLVILLSITVAATAAVVYFATRPGDAKDELVVSVMDAREAAALRINTLEVIDATGRSDIEPEVGRRYRVRISSESREGASCIARIGRMITFVDHVKPGDVVVVEVTRLKRNTAEAVVVKDASPAGGSLVPSAIAGTDAPSSVAATRAALSEPTPVHTGTVVFVGKFGDGMVKLEGHNVFIPGVEKGDRIAFEVTEKGERAWSGRLVAKLTPGSGAGDGGAGAPTMRSGGTAPGGRDFSAADHVQVGKEYDVTITDRDRDNPTTTGMVRIDGLVVLVSGTQPGDMVKIRITERRQRLAKAEVIERQAGSTTAP